MNLIKLLTAESQSNINVFNLLDRFYSIILNEDWLKKYIFWELDLLKILGYDLELKTLVNKKMINDKTLYMLALTSFCV